MPREEVEGIQDQTPTLMNLGRPLTLIIPHHFIIPKQLISFPSQYQCACREDSYRKGSENPNCTSSASAGLLRIGRAA